MSKIVIRLEKVKTLREIAQRELHNTRGKRVENSDGTGKVIIEGLTGVAKEIDMLTRKMNIELRKNGKRAIRKDAVRCIEIIVSSDREFFERYNYEKYFEDCNKFLKSFWGEESIIFFKTTHLDELVQHCHFMVSPIIEGKFNYSKFIRGKS
ncbi:plasmid recombination protein [Clostridium cagae]|uniref:plasmid recombination protein n=1 Tax=Clostridium cagae TaxID=2080751 RepID=UPI0028E1C285|nr:plasmid recombination protein [uncultured Clostridium sp.]